MEARQRVTGAVGVIGAIGAIGVIGALAPDLAGLKAKNSFQAMMLVALVAAASAAVEQPRKLEPVKKIEPSASAEAEDPASRGRRSLIHSAYTAPLTAAAVEVAAPVAYTYSANLPYAYSAYRAYAPYYSYPVVYV
jgi:hypothetical protein